MNARQRGTLLPNNIDIASDGRDRRISGVPRVGAGNLDYRSEATPTVGASVEEKVGIASRIVQPN